ncbi:uncharacterized protein LOC125775067 [Anopheles funestus]|uniref:uncharacterized protein LOC125775067 n=1 Tax=Anopheles funestus TaxID=62324 RepID=UPI0020C6EA7D|nr:uncharacterized protein LOC125775067 [Anopheles funestus]
MSRWPLTMCFAFSAMFCLTVQQADRLEDITAYLSHLTYTVQKEHLGVFNCWLLEFSNNASHSTVLKSLAHKLSAQHAGLLQANHQGNYVPTGREPNMVIIMWEKQEELGGNIYTHQWIANIPPECPTIVLFDRSCDAAQPQQIGTYFVTRNVLYFALIAINEDAIFTFHYLPLRITTHSGFPKLNELFFDRVKTIQYNRFAAAYVADFYTINVCDSLVGEDMKLFTLFAETEQFVANFVQLQCNRSETISLCLSRYDRIHFFVNRFFLVHYNKFAVSSTTMAQIAIATPRGRLLTVWEILLKPFQLSAWTVIFSVLVAFQLVQLCSPTLFANNILALALFGFEKRKLRLTKYGEKIATSALIIFFFQLKCAYEAKLVSYLTETPHLPDAVSVEDLRDRNITVYYKNVNIDYVDKLAGMVATHDGDKFFYDGITLMENREVLVAEKFFADSIEGYGMLYTILPENILEILPFYAFGTNSLYRKRFHKYQQRVFEAGMQIHWRRERFNCFLLHIVSAQHERGAKKRADVTIRYEHLKPLVLFFLAQWALEIVIFLGEMIIGRFGA